MFVSENNADAEDEYRMLIKMMVMMARMANDGWVGEYFGQTATH